MVLIGITKGTRGCSKPQKWEVFGPKKLREDKRLQVLITASRFIRPEIQAWDLTKEELEQAGDLSILGYACRR